MHAQNLLYFPRDSMFYIDVEHVLFLHSLKRKMAAVRKQRLY